MMKTMKMIAGLDIGNGYVKGTVQAENDKERAIDFMSGVAFEMTESPIKVKAAEIDDEIANIYNRMEASFDTSAVSSRSLRLFGERGTHSGNSMEEFDVASATSKTEQDLSAILILGSLAGAALQTYYEKEKALPAEVLPVDARIAVALPIAEYKRYRKLYIAKFRGIHHMVSIHNFEQPVRVDVLISDVQVLAEGASAQFAIVQHGEPVMEMMMEDLKAHGQNLGDITARDILSASNTVGIDIGEGTVNFPVFQDGRFNPDASITFSKGYGTVLDQAKDRLEMMGIHYSSRKALADFLLSKPSRLTRDRRDRAVQVVTEEAEGFVHELCFHFRKILSRVGAYVEVVYVYGGGAEKVKDLLYPRLLEEAKKFGGGDIMYPILYLGSGYSRYLNKEGLFMIAKEVAGANKE